MAILLLVRHATTAATGKRLGGWTPGVHLDEDGIAQAEATAALLARHPVVAVYSSPLERTRDTADIIAGTVSLDVRVREGLGETDYGDWTDRPLAELRKEKLWPVIQSTPSRVTFPGGESLRGSQQRMVDQLEELARDHGHGDIIVAVSHADPIKAAVAHFLGMPLDTFQRIMISPASITVLILGGDHPPVVGALNQVAAFDLPRAPESTDGDQSTDPTEDDDPTPDG